MTLPGVGLVPFLEWKDLTTSMLTMLTYVDIIIIQRPNIPLHKIALVIPYRTAKNSRWTNISTQLPLHYRNLKIFVDYIFTHEIKIAIGSM